MPPSSEFNSLAYYTVTTQRPLSEIVAHFDADGEHSSWSIGDPRPRNNLLGYKFSRWSLASGLERSAVLDDHLRALWRRMNGFRQKIQGLPDDMDGWVKCVSYFKSHKDKVELAAGHFSTAAYYRVNVDFDFYFDDDFGDEDTGTPYWDW